MHEHNSFITLTYNDDWVPQDYSVKLRDWQLFMKRLRKRTGLPIRFFACGEYGEQDLRPHYHALIFGFNFPDKKLWTTRRENPVYRSIVLESLWPFGFSEIGNLTYKSAAYCARYVMKKVPVAIAPEHYYRRSPVDGISYEVAPEFAVMSRRPGIGTSWFNEFASDAFPSDFLVVDGVKVKPPKFYLNKLQEDEQLIVKRERKAFAVKHRDNSTKERLAEREVVQNSKLKLLKRGL